MIYLKHNPKTVALLGMGPSLVDFFNETLTQECSPDWCDEVWAINMTANAARHDVVIWMDDLEQQENFKPGLFEMLRRYQTPVITSKARRDIVPNSYDYPISEVAQASIPYFGKPYLTNGVAMGIAYAIYKEVKVLKIYGCDFTYPNRNFAEEGRACTEAWITLASIKGMEVQLSPSTSLFDTVSDHGIYGYSEQPVIDMPDGTKFKYETNDKGPGKYVATDSSGATNVSTYLPRKPGESSSIDGGDTADDPASEAESVATEESGESVAVEDNGGPGRSEVPHPSRINGSGGPGDIQDSA